MTISIVLLVVVFGIQMTSSRYSPRIIGLFTHEVAELCVRFFNTYLRSALNRSAPTFPSSTMNEYRRLAIGALEWRPDLAVEAAAHLLRYGRRFDQMGMPAISVPPPKTWPTLPSRPTATTWT